MAEAATPIEVLDLDVIMHRSESGLIVPMHQESGLTVVDCADDRGLTPDYYARRIYEKGSEVSPGRYFGAASGIAVASLITYAAEHGDAAVTEFVRDYSAEGFVDFASDLSDRAFSLPGSIEINQHSDNTKEQNPIELGDHKTCEDPLGCAFATKLGAVMFGADKPGQIQEAKEITAVSGINLPIDEAAEGIRIMQRHIPEDFGVHRGALHHAQTRSSRHTPIAIHKGQHAPNEQARLVVDMAGYRSNANRNNQAGLNRYHHTPGIPGELLPRIMPEIRLDPRLLEATGLLLGASTRLALSGAQTPHDLKVEVIPPEFAKQAA